MSKLVSAALVLGFGGWALFSMYERIVEIAAAPDLTGDGKFTIVDLPHAVFSVVVEVGHRYQAVFADSSFGQFLEMDATEPNLFWSVVLAGFTYFLVIAWTGDFFRADEEGA